jgi:predicted DNA-binding transcriptional regulator YafY
VLADLGLDRAAEAGLIKLLAAMPSVSRRGAEDVRQRIHVDVSGWSQSAEVVPYLPILQDAVWQERRLRMSYERGDGTAVERVVDPLGLVAKGRLWYLVAAVEGEARSYRVSRVREAEVLDEPCARPPDFDLAAFWERSAASFTANLPRYPATVRVEADLVPYLRAIGRYARIAREYPPGPADPDGWVRLDMLFEGEHNAREYVLGFGPRIEVLEPAALREQILRAAEGIIARYTATARTSG